MIETDLGPEGELLSRLEMQAGHGDPSGSHRAVGTHDGVSRSGVLKELVMPARIDTHEQVAIAPGRDQHPVIDHEGESAEHVHFSHVTAGEKGSKPLCKSVVSLGHQSPFRGE